MAEWVVVTPAGEVVDGPIDMSESMAMGFNQTRALTGHGARWEEYDPSVHGDRESIARHLAAIDAEFGVED